MIFLISLYVSTCEVGHRVSEGKTHEMSVKSHHSQWLYK